MTSIKLRQASSQYWILSFRGIDCILTRIEKRILENLSFTSPTPRDVLLAKVYPEKRVRPSKSLLVHLHNLRGKIEPLGLHIDNLNKKGEEALYILRREG